MKYIAYGSNMNVEQMKVRCPQATIAGTTYLEEYTLAFCNVATIIPKENSSVPVVIWDITDEDEKALDRYEGYPNLYRKETVEVIVNDEIIDAFVYIMNTQKLGMPSQEYYTSIKEGYISAGFDTNILKEFLKQTRNQLQRSRYYLAYGTDMMSKEMKSICQSAKLIKKSFMYGVEMCFKGEKNQAIADIEVNEYGKTAVAVYHVSAEDEDAMDHLKSEMYTHKHEMSTARDGEVIETFTYYGTNATFNLPSDDYFELLKKGYEATGHNHKLLIDVLDRTADMMEKQTNVQTLK